MYVHGENSEITELFSLAMETRLHALIVNIENTEDYKKANDSFIECLSEIKSFLPEEKKHLAVVLDDYLSAILCACERYYYKNGFFDSAKLSELINSNQIIKNL